MAVTDIIQESLLGYRRMPSNSYSIRTRMPHSASSSPTESVKVAPASATSWSFEKLNGCAMIVKVALESRNRHAKRAYIGSEMVSCMRDAHIVSTRSEGSQVLRLLVSHGVIHQVDGTSASEGSPAGFYSFRNSTKGSTAHEETFDVASSVCKRTSKCHNCNQTYHVNMSQYQGFCSVDCRTNAAFRRMDSQRFKAMYD